VSQIQESIDVDVPVATAYNAWTQFESFPQFMGGVESITQLDDTHNHWVTKIAGVTREFDTEITEQHPDERIAWHSVSGDTHHAGVVTFHRLGGTQTRVMTQIDWEPTGVLEKVGAAVNIDDHQVHADAQKFKEFVESGAGQSAGWRGNVDQPACGRDRVTPSGSVKGHA
jgi:uncharacterized membrane protein